MLKPLYPDTLFRPSRARQLLEAESGQIGIESFARAFRDHFSFPSSICRHEDERAEGILQWVTLYSTIMDLNEQALYTAKGYPCQSEYQKIRGKNGS
jgi:isopenicillin-N N-acyltransferase-like protein